MSETGESVVRMANQIARNLMAQGEEAAFAGTAEHIRLFWDPRMKEAAFALLSEPDCGFSSLARAAIAHLAEGTGHRTS